MDKNDLYQTMKDIVSYLAQTTDEEDIYAFLRDLLSEKEMLESARRLEVAKMLSQKYSYLQIEETTGMSSTTIARISKFLSGQHKGYQKALEFLWKKD